MRAKPARYSVAETTVANRNSKPLVAHSFYLGLIQAWIAAFQNSNDVTQIGAFLNKT